MCQAHPIHNLLITSGTLTNLIDEFDYLINSKRLRSRIHRLSELIDILWKRNLFQNNGNGIIAIFVSHFSSLEQQNILKDYIECLKNRGKYNKIQRSNGKFQ